MLIKCPECNHDVSDTAVNCPNCGYNIKDNIEEAKTHTKEQENEIAEKRKKIGKWIRRCVLASILIFIIVLIGEGIYVSKYKKYEQSMQFIKALEASIESDDYHFDSDRNPDLSFNDITKIIHINYETIAVPEDDSHYTRDYYYVKHNNNIYMYMFSMNDLNGTYIFTNLEQYKTDLNSVYYKNYKAANNALSQYYFGNKTDDYHYDEEIELSDYNLLLTHLMLIINNPKPS